MSLNAFQSSPTVLAEALIEAPSSRDTDGAPRLIELGANPAYGQSLPLAPAAAFGHIALLERLLPLSEVNARDCRALRWAAEHGKTQALRLLASASASAITPFCVFL